MYSLLTCFPGIFCNYFQLFQPTPQLYISPGGIGRYYGNIYTSTPTASFSFQLIQSNILCGGGGILLIFKHILFRSSLRGRPVSAPPGKNGFPIRPFPEDSGDLPPHSPRYQIQGTYSLTPPGIRYRGPTPSLPKVLDTRTYPLTLPGIRYRDLPPHSQLLDIQGTYPLTPPDT